MGLPIKVVQKTFKVVEFLNDQRTLSLHQLAELTGMPKPTVCRILDTLQAMGYVEQDAQTQRFSLGSKFLAFVRRSGSGSDLLSAAEPYLQKLSEQFCETVNLARLIDNDVVYVRILESTQAFRISDNLGDRGSVHSTAIGKAVAAFLSPDRLDQVLHTTTYTAYTKKTIVTEAALREHLVAVREQGYAIDDEEGHDGVLCIGAPVFGKDHLPLGGMSLSMPKVRAKKSVLQRIVHELPRVAIQLSLDLGVTDIRKCFQR